MSQPILNALRALADQCDGAHSYDNVGFNKPDSYRCKYWATLETLTDGQAFDAWQRLRKYKEQLAKLGIDYDAILQPARVDLKASDLARPFIGRNAPGESQTRIIRTERDETGAEVFTLAWPNKDATELVPRLREFFSARKYKPEPYKRWHVAADSRAGRLLEFALQYDFDVSEEACALFDSIAIPQADVAQSDAPIRKYPDRIIKQGVNKKGKEAIEIWFNYVPAVYVAVKELEDAQFHDGRDGSGKHWSVSYAASEAVLQMAEALEFNIDADCKARLEVEIQKIKDGQVSAKRRAAVLLEAAKDIPYETFGGKKVRDYQAAGISFMLNAIGHYEPQSGVILADQVGLGKTFQAMLIARCFQKAFSAHVFIVCPVSLQGDWIKEAAACDVRVEVSSWAKIPKPVSSPYMVIADECHFMQDIKSQRTKDMLKLTQAPSCLTFIPASATPMRGQRPKNIFPVLQAIRHPLGKNQKRFEERFCNRRLRQLSNGREFWDVSGRANLNELMREIAPVYLQRLKKNVLKDLPPLTVTSRQVESSSEAKAIYDKVFRDAQATFNARRLATEQKIKEELAKGKTLKEIEFTKEDAREGAEAVVLLGHLRRAASFAMIQPTIEFAEDILDTGEQVMIYSEYPEVCERIAAYFNKADIPAEVLTGDVKAIDRDRAKERFQSGQSRVFCLTKAGGVGLTLTAASNGILVDQPWLWDDVVQIAGRLHRKDSIMEKRIKETENPAVMAYLLKGFEINEKIQARLFDQKTISDQIENGAQVNRKAIKSINQLAKEIARELFEVKKQ